ncbi:MAG: DNA polymerase Y family protein, partial [Pseudomonadota bacterium]
MLCVWFPELEIELLARRNGGLQERQELCATRAPRQGGHPCILYSTQANTQVVTAVNAAARALGLAPGRRLTDALACVPGITCAEAMPDRDAEARQQIARWLQAFGTRTGHEDNFFWIDITGVDHLFDGEAHLANRVALSLRRHGLSARLAIAGTYALARALAACRASAGEKPCIAASGREHLDALPIPLSAALRCNATVDRLGTLGLRTVGDLARLDRKELSQRFLRDDAGAMVLDQLDTLLGRRTETLHDTAVEPRYFRQRNFFTPLTTAPAINAALDFLLARLCADLESEQADGRHFMLRFIRTDASAHMVEIRTHRPTRAPQHLRGLLEEKIQNIDLGFGVETIRLEVLEALPFTDGAQISLDQASALADRQAEVLDRVGARIGPERVCLFAHPDAHHPHLRQQFIPATSAAHEKQPVGGRAGNRGSELVSAQRPASARTRVAAPTGPRHPDSTAERPAVMLANAEPVQVTCTPDGTPQMLHWRAL